MIKVDNLVKSFVNGSVKTEVLKGVRFGIEKGEFVSIVGPSGSGKSTLVGLIAGLDTPDGGSVVLSDTEITSMSERRLAAVRGKLIGYVFQSFNLISTLSAVENVELPMILNGMGREAGKRAIALLEEVGVGDRLHNLPSQLSGGEQQRVAIARALACDPPIIIADEPTGNLDSKTSQHVTDLLLGLCRDHGKTLIIVTHDRELASIADRVLVMKDGVVDGEEVA